MLGSWSRGQVVSARQAISARRFRNALLGLDCQLIVPPRLEDMDCTTAGGAGSFPCPPGSSDR